MIYKAYREKSLLMGICSEGVGDLFDGYVDLSEEEKTLAESAERDYFHWQELLRKRYKKA